MKPMFTDVVSHVRSDGHVSYLFPVELKAYCPLNTYYFPFDQHVCPLKFGPWVLDSSQVSNSEKQYIA